MLAVDVFHVGARGLGLLLAAPALGSVMASLAAGTLQHVRYKGRFVVGAVLVWGPRDRFVWRRALPSRR